MIVAIIAGGEKSRFRRIDEADFIIACDKGAQYAAEEGVVPDLTAGDFDSVPKGFRPAGETAVLPTEKNDTDTMFAVRKALSWGCAQIYLYCAEGGRPDHFLGNIQAALFAAARVVLRNLGIPDSPVLSLSQIRNDDGILSNACCNGDGVITPGCFTGDLESVLWMCRKT